MKRNVDLKEISDGRIYSENDMVKADCHDCEGCSECCHNMGDSIILDPKDLYELTINLGRSVAALIENELELGVAMGLILPHIRMQESTNGCAFLNSEGRCSIHDFRPGICRLFPLGRYYENGQMYYILQTGECKKNNRTKIKIEKWLQVSDFKKYQQFVKTWHDFTEAVRDLINEQSDEEYIRKINLYLLQLFYLKEYNKDMDFYLQIEERLDMAREVLFS